MTYEIIITKKDESKVVENGPWSVVERRPWTDQEFQSASEPMYGHSREALLAKTPLKEVMGYAPQREVLQRTEKEIYKQEVEELDLSAVIKAVNGGK